jgi:hypothetical protein
MGPTWTVLVLKVFFLYLMFALILIQLYMCFISYFSSLRCIQDRSTIAVTPDFIEGGHMEGIEVDEKNSSNENSATSVASSLISVKFKTLARQAIESIKNDATHSLAEARQVPPFASWTSSQLRSLLAEHGVEVRCGDSAPHATLVRICEALFAIDSDISPPPALSKEDFQKAEDAARLIQHTYFSRMVVGGEDKSDKDSTDTEFEAGDDDHELTVEWRRPSYRYAKRLDVSSRPNRDGKPLDWRRITLGRHCTMTGCGEQFDLWDEGCTSELSQFGSGITNYFKFLKWCCWVMVILSILHLPVLFINLMGGQLQYEANNAASTTFGNLGGADEVFFVRLPFCDVGDFANEGSCLISKDRLAIGFAWLDAASTIFVIFAWLWLRNFQAKETKCLDRSTVSASDYTLCVRGIPSDATEDDLMDHFQQIAGGEPVADVHLAFANSKEISLYFHRGKLMKKRYNVVQRIRYELTRKRFFEEGAEDKDDPSTSSSSLRYKPLTNPQKIAKRLARLHAERTKLTAQICIADEEHERIMVKDCGQSKAIQAFVTYQTESALIKAIGAYQLSWFQALGLCCCYPKKLKLRGHRLTVSEAAEPSTIIWENLEYSNLSRFLRQCLSGTVALLAICISVACTFRARDFQAKTLAATALPCPGGFYSLDADQQRDIIEQNTELAHCFCSTLGISEQFRISSCTDYVAIILKSRATNYAAGFLVVGINMAFSIIFDRFGAFERHESIETREASNLMRVFLLKVVNTGALVLLYSQTWLQKLFLVRLKDSSPEWDVEWYATGAVSLIIVMCMNAITPHIFPVVQYLRHRSKVRRLEKHIDENKDIKTTFRKVFYSQEELNEYVGSNATFCLNYRISQTLVTFYICFVYALSMPLLLFIGAVSFFISFWIDKWLFCRFYRTPPVYSDRMGQSASKLLGFSIVLHLILSLWSLGTNDKIFDGLDAFINGSTPSDINAGVLTSLIQRVILKKRHLIILEAVLLTFFAALIISKFSHGLGSGLLGICRCFACQATNNQAKKLEKTRNTLEIDYRSACQRGIIKGLASYNILKNPRYAEAFGISAEFAEGHKRVGSIRGLNANEGGGMV